jgi:glucosamine--fructose-6-phosphate aminotransferase (isomerizing)
VTAGLLAAADIADQTDVLGAVLDRNAGELVRARALLRPARVVRLVGFGSSKHAAGYGAEALDVLGGLPATVLPAPGAAVPTPQPHADEPLIVLSQSGRTPALIAVAERAAASGVAVIAVTNEPKSPLEEIASVTLGCHAGAERVVAATKSVTAQCLLLRALADDVPAQMHSSLVDAVQRSAHLEGAGAVGATRPAAVVAAGFAAEWIADELALKLTEMAGFAVTSNSVVEHFHGPKASGEAVLAFLDPQDPNSGELAQMPNVTTVGPNPAFDVETPTTGDASLDAIVALVAGQRIARAWALHLGEDPDADRGLSKVTCTR